MRSLPRVALVVLVPGALTAQIVPTHISPVAAATGLGNSNNNIPFSWSPCSYQQVHGVTSFSSTQVGLWQRMALRMANGFANNAGRTVDLELFLAESPNDGASASGTFANNVVSGSEINVMPRTMVNLPQIPDNSWSMTLPFTTPFLFTGLAHISWRVNNYGNSNNNSIFTYPLDAWSSWGSSQGLGSGCRSNNGTSPAQHSAVVPAPGQVAQFYGYSYVPAGGLAAVLTIGNSASSFFGVPLPFDLTPLGAPSCSLYVNWLLVLTGSTNANSSGSVQINVPLPNDPALTGSTIHSQYLFADPTGNALGLFTSNGQSTQVGEARNTARIYGLGGPGLTGGSLERQYGMAIAFN